MRSTITLKLLCCLATLFASFNIQAADDQIPPKIEAPSITMQLYLQAQRDYVKKAVADQGSWLNGNEYDLKTFQRFINDRSFDKKDRRLMQAIGIYMGDLLAKASYGNFRWASYEDSKGKSRALCLREQTPCVFPVTLISRRTEGGAPIDIYAIYQRVLKQLQDVEVR